MDEYNAKSLTKKEVSTIVKLFLEKEPFKMSKILLALQPIEIKRKDFHYIKGQETEYWENGNMLAELEKIMTVKSLQHVMRTTVEINTLVEITQEYLNEKLNLYTRNIASSERLLEKEVLQNPNIGIHANLLEDESAIADSNIDANLQKDDLVTKSSTIQNFVLDHNSAISENAPIGVTQKASNSNSYVDFDELHKLTSTEVRDSGEHCQKRETKYR